MDDHPISRPSASVFRERNPAWAREFEAILEAYKEAGGRPDILQTPRVASVVISGNRVLALNLVDGVEIEAEELEDGVRARIVVAPGTVVDYPVHLCFGMVAEEGRQRILSEFEVGAQAEISFLTHCTFPNAVDLEHVMDAQIHIGPGATMRYSEGHYHGPVGGIKVLPTTSAYVDKGGRLESEFNLVHGRVGCLDIKFDVDVAADGVVELSTKAYGSGEDEIRVSETVRLNGERARDHNAGCCARSSHQ
jgi:Fe-S cluster assembly scaffold protein SufB